MAVGRWTRDLADMPRASRVDTIRVSFLSTCVIISLHAFTRYCGIDTHQKCSMLSSLRVGSSPVAPSLYQVSSTQLTNAETTSIQMTRKEGMSESIVNIAHFPPRSLDQEGCPNRVDAGSGLSGL